VDKWHAYLGEPTLADAILDRIIHHSHRIELKTGGDSLRKSLGMPNPPRSPEAQPETNPRK
jgi:DNA replication protein DnaC